VKRSSQNPGAFLHGGQQHAERLLAGRHLGKIAKLPGLQELAAHGHQANLKLVVLLGECLGNPRDRARVLLREG
jgi:hypothetical protein